MFQQQQVFFMAFVSVRSGSYNWNVCITIWGKKNQCVSHLRVCCHLEHLLLLPVSAWRLPCCSVPARGSLWSSSIKTSSPAKFITAKGRDGYEPTHQLWLHVQVRCELQVNSCNMGRETVPDPRLLFSTVSSAIWTARAPSQPGLFNYVPTSSSLLLWDGVVAKIRLSKEHGGVQRDC